MKDLEDIKKVELLSILEHFLDVHKIGMQDKNKILWEAEHVSFLRCIYGSIIWRYAPEGYNFYYFLNLRWIYVLIKLHKEYEFLGSRTYLVSLLGDCIKFSEAGTDEKNQKQFKMMKKRYEKIFRHYWNH